MLNDKQEARVAKLIEEADLDALIAAMIIVAANPLDKKTLKDARKQLVRITKVIDKALAIVAPAPKPNSGTVVTSGRGRHRKVAK